MARRIASRKARESFDRIRQLDRSALRSFVDETMATMIEEEALAVFDNPWCDSSIVSRIAQSDLTSRRAIRYALVSHRQTPQGHAMKFVHHLDWQELLRLSTNVRVNPAIRRSIDEQMRIRLRKITAGEKVAASKFCSQAIILELCNDPDIRIFRGLLINQRMTEDILLQAILSEVLTGEQMAEILSNDRWKYRLPLLRALVKSPGAPRAVAASCLPRLPRADIEEIAGNPGTPVYLRRCIERLELLG